jgi:CheY-like chemotaxis protein
MPSRFSILLIEDSPVECELLRLALAQTGLGVALYTDGLFSLSR